MQAQGEDWKNVLISLPIFDDVDADIRVSADPLIVGAMHLEDLAVSAIAKTGSISLRLGVAGLDGGRIHASLTVDYQAPRSQARTPS